MTRIEAPRNVPVSRTDPEDASRQRAVLLVNVGTPDGPELPAVRRYLEEFLSDPLVIQLPPLLRWLQRPLARFIALRRGPQSAHKYRSIWTPRGSPLRVIMEDQAAELGRLLPSNWRVFLGMRYGQPSIADALQTIVAAGIDEVVVVPLYPQYSQTTTGTVVQELYAALQRTGLHINVSTRSNWHDDAGYANAQARLIADFAAEHELWPAQTILLYSAHGLPASYIERGDPYLDQVRQSLRLITQRLGWPESRTALAFQSRFGPTKWLAPDTSHQLADLAARGERQVLLCPISFAVDCLETLEEIEVQYRPPFEAAGGRLFRCPALNTYSHFITALKNLVLRGPQPITTWNGKHAPLLAEAARPRPADRQLDQFFMVGVSLASRIGSGRGPRLVYADADGLQCTRKPHGDVATLLQSLKAAGAVREALVWNTCHRFEFYGWLETRTSDDACTVDRVRRQVLGEHPDTPANVLLGASAWHHLMRTIIGLNSGLPGDKDIVEQFQGAFQLAERSETAGPRLRALVDEAVALAQGSRDQTTWGRTTVGYCYAALDRIARQLDRRLANCRHVVVGGSATARSILRGLFEHFAVRPADATLVYRAHQGGQARQLRSAIGNGRRLRTDAYNSREVLQAIADADIVYYGVDRAEPVLTRADLEGLRDFAARPLVVVDLNTSGSTRELEQVTGVTLWTAERIDAEVQAFADELAAQETFPQIVQEAESWVASLRPPHVPPGLPCAQAGTDPCCSTCGRSLSELVGGRTDHAVRTG